MSALQTVLEGVYADVMTLVDTVQRQLSMLQSCSGIPAELQQAFAARKNRVAKIIEAWRSVEEHLRTEPPSAELDGLVQKIQLGVHLFTELDSKLVEQLKQRAQHTVEVLLEHQRLADGLAHYGSTVQASNQGMHLLRLNPSRWLDERT